MNELLRKIMEAKEPLEKQDTAVPSAPERPKRCQHIDCKAKLALTDFACQCKGFYCIRHRHAEIHSCPFDYKDRGHTQLEKQLVKTVAEKVEKI